RIRHRCYRDRNRHTADFRGDGVCFAKLLAGAQTVIVFLKVFPDEPGAQLAGWLDAQRDTRGPQIAAIDGIACKFVSGVAVALRPFAGDAKIGAIIDDREVYHPFEPAILIVAQIAAGHRFELVRWLGRYEIHHAGRGVAAIKRTLWPA